MNSLSVDVIIVGAGPVGLLCAYLAQICDLSFVIVDKSKGPLQQGRADALNARTLQYLEIIKLFSKLYPLGKTCNTSSVWADGNFVSKQSSWWTSLVGCLHRHFLMLGQAHIENLLDELLADKNKVIRNSNVNDIQFSSSACRSILSTGQIIESKYVIGADGAKSFVRKKFKVPFEIIMPEMIWAVIDGIVETDFPKVPEIIVFQNETSDVAWIPREANLDRFYIRIDKKEFQVEEIILKINESIKPYKLKFNTIEWVSDFSVKEAVAEKFSINNKIFLAGDACHIHSVNGGQGLNTGLADAFNLIWKMNMVINHNFSEDVLISYEKERKSVALSVVETSGELVRSTKYSEKGTHALNYVEIVKKRSGHITGMGIQYGTDDIIGTRLHDFEIFVGDDESRIYSKLEYTNYTLLVFDQTEFSIQLPKYIKKIQIHTESSEESIWTHYQYYRGLIVLVRPDSYIQDFSYVKDRSRIEKIIQNNSLI